MRAENLFVLEAYFRQLVDGDPEKMAAIREHVGLDEDIDTMTMEELVAVSAADEVDDCS